MFSIAILLFLTFDNASMMSLLVVGIEILIIYNQKFHNTSYSNDNRLLMMNVYDELIDITEPLIINLVTKY